MSDDGDEAIPASAPVGSGLHEFALKLSDPLSTAAGEITARRGVLVAGQDTTGTIGLGEATPLPGWTEPYDECLATLYKTRNTDGGIDPHPAAVPLDDRPGAPAARHGLELARLDARARATAVPLSTLLADDVGDGGTVHDRVPVNATVGDAGRNATVAAAEDAVAAGFDCLKLKVGVRELEADLERVRAVRDAVPATVSVRVDANGAWSQPTARRAVEALEGTVEYVEQPLPGPALEAHADLAGVGAPIALDETLTTHDPAAVLAADAATVLVVKPMALGGVGRARLVADRARAVGVDIVVTTTIDAAVARAGAVHLAASLPNVRPCGLATGSLLDGDLLEPDPAPIDGGAATRPSGPGLGEAFAHLRRAVTGD